jgi:hypothetical protein
MPQIGTGVILGLLLSGIAIWWLDLPPGSGASLLVLLMSVGFASALLVLFERIMVGRRSPEEQGSPHADTSTGNLRPAGRGRAKRLRTQAAKHRK